MLALSFFLEFLERGVARVSREGDHVANVLDAGSEHDETLEAQAEARVLDRAVPPAMVEGARQRQRRRSRASKNKVSVC